MAGLDAVYGDASGIWFIKLAQTQKFLTLSKKIGAENRKLLDPLAFAAISR